MALSKSGAKAADLNLILAEIALWRAEAQVHLTGPIHIPGLANLRPDALSRLKAPTPSAIPEVAPELRSHSPARAPTWWLLNRRGEPPGATRSARSENKRRPSGAL